MNIFRNIRITAVATLAPAVVALALAGSVVAAPAPLSPQNAITVRQAGFKKMGAAMKALNEQLKSSAPAKGPIATYAQTIATTAREQGRLFPAGSGPTAGIKTDALANIWTDRGTFDAQMTKLVAESGKLAAVTNGNDMDAIRAQAKTTGAVCAGCHRQFRADS
jgi:cytochrome c556